VRPGASPWYNADMVVLAVLVTWLVLSALAAVLLCLVCRAGHAEDVARHYVED
jgi:hypothetical protein